MRSLHDAMLMIADDKKHIEDIEGFENAYLGENRLSSVNEAEVKAFATLLFNPLLNEVSKIAKTKEERQQLTDYMMAKWKNSLNSVISTMPKLYFFILPSFDDMILIVLTICGVFLTRHNLIL